MPSIHTKDGRHRQDYQDRLPSGVSWKAKVPCFPETHLTYDCKVVHHRVWTPFSPSVSPVDPSTSASGRGARPVVSRREETPCWMNRRIGCTSSSVSASWMRKAFEGGWRDVSGTQEDEPWQRGRGSASNGWKIWDVRRLGRSRRPN